MSDSIVIMPDIPVKYVQGTAGRPIAEQAPSAFQELESKLPSLKRRKFYGVIADGVYRACVVVRPEDPADSLPYPSWVIPGGKHARRKIADFTVEMIAPVVEEMLRRPDVDPSRPVIEHYRNQRELLLLVPML